jgi:hypothetical protein
VGGFPETEIGDPGAESTGRWGKSVSRSTRVVAIAAGVVVAAIVAALFYLDGIARRAIERGASYALGVEASLDSASIGLLTGSFRLAGLEVANPPGFEGPRFLGLSDARLDLDLGTLREATVIVPSFVLQGVEVDLDKERGRANYEAILDNLARFESAEEPEPAAEANAGEGKRFVIQELVIRDVLAHVRVVEAGRVPQLDVVVPEVRMRDLGGEGEPLTMAQVTDVIVKAVLASIAKAGTGLPGGVANALSGGLGRLTSVSVELPEGGRLVDSAAGALDAGAGAARDALGEAKSATEGAGKKLKNLGGKLLGDD